MPKLVQCKHGGCYNTAVPGHLFCSKHMKEERDYIDRKNQYARQRRESAAYHYLYSSSKWRQASAYWLKVHPVCEVCGRPAQVVDHIIPHKGNVRMFWDKGNWQSLCKHCHDVKTCKERKLYK